MHSCHGEAHHSSSLLQLIQGLDHWTLTCELQVADVAAEAAVTAPSLAA